MKDLARTASHPTQPLCGIARLPRRHHRPTGAARDKELAPLSRDELVDLLNTRRSAIQHAADAIWPWNDEAH